MSVHTHPDASAPVPDHCHLYHAFGRTEPCPGLECIYRRVPGISGCAIEQWAPDVEEDQVKAGWFLARRLEAEAARAAREDEFGSEPGAAPPLDP